MCHPYLGDSDHETEPKGPRIIGCVVAFVVDKVSSFEAKVQEIGNFRGAKLGSLLKGGVGFKFALNHLNGVRNRD